MTAPARKTTAAKKTAAKPATIDAPTLPNTQKVEQATTSPSVEEQLAEATEQLAAMTELADARGERITLLEAQLAAQVEQAKPQVVEVFVRDGQGRCLHCACEKFTEHPDNPALCWGCNHEFDQHKRNPAGAVWQEVDAA